jgi:signal transduction histidine kinase
LENNYHLFTEGKISIKGDIKEELMYFVDRQLFEMLLMNLISNSLRYNESMEKYLEISFKIEGKNLCIGFKDNGIGLLSKNKKKIFKKFYQVGKAENCTAKGTGLGLYLVQQITKIHGGKIKAESKGVGTGSTFNVYLPFPPKRKMV